MKRLIILSCLLGFLLGAVPSSTAQQSNSIPVQAGGITCVIPIKGMIESGLLVYVVRKGIAEALDQKAGVIILDMDTPGGMLPVTEEIVRLLIDLPPSVKTCTFINKDALSAGAFIALATDEIYMAPGSRIGASAIVTLFGDIPDGDMKAKMYSSTLALVQRVAQTKGRDEKLVEAMMHKETGYKVGDRTICEPGRLLTLNDMQAAQIIGEGDTARPLLSQGTVKDMDELLEKIGRKNTRLEYFQIGRVEEIARMIKALQALFLIGGLVGLYIEFKTPGFGLPGIAGILCLVIFFWAQYAAGLAGSVELLLLVVGIALLLIELLVLPGFGLAGIAGLICIVGAAVMAVVQHYPGTPWHQIPELQMRDLAITFGGGILGTAAIVAILARYLPKTSVFNQIALATSTTADLGFVAAEREEGLIGAKGTAITPLHPAGTGMFGEKRRQVVTRGDFIEANASIVVVEVKGNRIVVQKD